MINIIAATCYRGGIGMKNKLPWKLKGDINYFKKMTIGDHNNCVIMGRNTWESLPEKARPLKDRHNIILSNTLSSSVNIQDTTIKSSLEDALEFACYRKFSNTWIIGGANVYDAAIRTGLVNEIHITNIENDIPCDTFFPNISKDYHLRTSSNRLNEGNIRYRFEIYIPDHQMKKIMMFRIWQSILNKD